MQLRCVPSECSCPDSISVVLNMLHATLQLASTDLGTLVHTGRLQDAVLHEPSLITLQETCLIVRVRSAAWSGLVCIVTLCLSFALPCLVFTSKAARPNRRARPLPCRLTNTWTGLPKHLQHRKVQERTCCPVSAVVSLTC